MQHVVVVSLQVVDHLLLGNEMCGFVDQRHERVEFVRPVVEEVIGVFGPLKVNDTSQSVHLGIDSFVNNKAGEELLRFLMKQVSRQTFCWFHLKIPSLRLNPKMIGAQNTYIVGEISPTQSFDTTVFIPLM